MKWIIIMRRNFDLPTSWDVVAWTMNNIKKIYTDIRDVITLALKSRPDDVILPWKHLPFDLQRDRHDVMKRWTHAPCERGKWPPSNYSLVFHFSASSNCGFRLILALASKWAPSTFLCDIHVTNLTRETARLSIFRQSSLSSLTFRHKYKVKYYSNLIRDHPTACSVRSRWKWTLISAVCSFTQQISSNRSRCLGQISD